MKERAAALLAPSGHKPEDESCRGCAALRWNARHRTPWHRPRRETCETAIVAAFLNKAREEDDFR